MPTSHRGFTLIELMMAVSIIAALSAIGLVVYSQALSKGRDFQRKQDLQAVARALGLYYEKNSRYPCTNSASFPSNANYSSGGGEWLQDQPATGCSGGQTLAPDFLDQLPLDPKDNQSSFYQDQAKFGYGYWAGVMPGAACPEAPSQFYVLFARLEEANDPDSNDKQRYRDCDGDVLFDPSNPAYQSLYVVTSP